MTPEALLRLYKTIRSPASRLFATHVARLRRCMTPGRGAVAAAGTYQARRVRLEVPGALRCPQVPVVPGTEAQHHTDGGLVIANEFDEVDVGEAD